MTASHDFEPVEEVVTDEHARVYVGHTGARGKARYAVSKAPDGSILLTPMVNIPSHELFVWRDAELRASLVRGLAEVADGIMRPRPEMLDAVPEVVGETAE